MGTCKKVPMATKKEQRGEQKGWPSGNRQVLVEN
jgi:hypothetical protein